MSPKKPLGRYLSIIAGREKTRFLGCHELDERLSAAREILKECHLCERRCQVNRLEGKKGFCRVLEPRIASEFIHLGEESELVPSYTIFLSGCTFQCVYCQNWDISQFPARGIDVKAETLAGMISRADARNVNWVGGDPTPNLPYILEVLTKLKRNIPQVWNSNMYLSEESMQLLDGIIDIYLTDFKYGNNECAERLSKAGNYTQITERNHLLAEKQAEVIIRHLVLPGHLECCTRPVLEWISENLGSRVKVNVMAQYRPEYMAMEYEELAYRLSREEFQQALNLARELDLDLVER